MSYARRIYLVANWLVGDSLGLCSRWTVPEPDGLPRYVICNEYNRDVFEFVTNHTQLRLDGYGVLPDAESLGDMEGYHAYTRRMSAGFDDPETDLIPMHPLVPLALTPFPMRHDLTRTPRRIAGPYMTLQPASGHAWKTMEQLEQVRCPLPVCVITQSGLWTPSWATHLCTDESLGVVSEFIRHAVCHVGICGAMTIFAALLGVPTLMIHASGAPIGDGGVGHLPKCRDIPWTSAEEVGQCLQSFVASVVAGTLSSGIVVPRLPGVIPAATGPQP